MSKITLGSFVLERPIGRGAMGAVWSAIDRTTGTPVAVKLLPGDLENDSVQRGVAAEVRAVARLEHPGIVWLVDHGTVTAGEAERSEGTVREGAHWLAMELATGGTLARWTPRDWPEAKEVLAEILAALAHAHARGIVHRDLKPSNVLRCTAEDLRPGWKLSDFGIAWAAGLGDGIGTFGTPRYMAPEQFRGTWRVLGPWTDLYALGCVAWKVVCGRSPFSSFEGLELARAHQAGVPTPFVPRMDVPHALEGWLQTLLAPPPALRFRRAADARHALDQLESPLPMGGGGPTLEPVEDDEASTQRSIPGADLLEPDRWNAGARLATPPPLPRTWRRTVPHTPPGLRTAGRSLWGLRETQAVGREDERDTLWGLLGRAAAGQAPAVIAITGEPGYGRTRLAGWLARRAHEEGVATVLRTRSDPDDPPGAALRRLGEDLLGLEGLVGPERDRQADVSLRLLHAPGAAEPAAAVDWVAAADADPATRYGRFRRLLQALATERLPLLVLDDAAADADVLGLVRHLCTASTESRMLVVLPLSEEAWSRVGSDLTQLGVERFALGPMPLDRLEQLVRSVLVLEPRLQREVVRAASGSPATALALMGGLVLADKLVASAAGFALRPGERLEVPDTRASGQLIDAALVNLPLQARVLLERAAVLGAVFDEGIWIRACDDPDGVARATGHDAVDLQHNRLRALLLTRLGGLRLLRPTATGWRFADISVRQHVLLHAKQAGRWAEHHAACAAALRGLGTDAERLGEHLIEAGQLQDGFRMLAGAVLGPGRGGPAATLVGVERCLSVAAQLGWGPLHPEVRPLITCKVGRLNQVGLHDEALAVGLPQRELLRQRGVHDEEASLRRELSSSMLTLGRAEDALAEMKQGLAVARSAEVRGRLAHQVARALVSQGHPDRARAYAEQAVTLLQDLPASARWRYLDARIEVCQLDGDHAGVRACAEEMLACAGGVLETERLALRHDAESARALGDLDGSERSLRRALEIDLLRGYGRSAAWDWVNLAVCARERGDTRSALQCLSRVGAASDGAEVTVAAHTVRAALCADLGRWSEVTAALDRCEAWFSAPHRPEADAVELLEHIEMVASAASRRIEAARAADLAQRERRLLEVARTD